MAILYNNGKINIAPNKYFEGGGFYIRINS